MYIFVIDKNNKSLMPTNPRQARLLLKKKQAIVIKLEPFTIKLKKDSTSYIQDITLGIDAGTKHIGISAAQNNSVLFEAEVELRDDIKSLIDTKRENRRSRRSRKTRYRKCRFLNRKRKEKWLAPSIEHKVSSHRKIVDFICKILPIKKIIVETAQFDIQKIKNPDIEKEEYQKGAQLNFFNVREYVLFRDNHTCQLCKRKNKILNVHHIESRKTGSNSPDNLITLCEDCHKKIHSKKSTNLFAKKDSFKDASQITTTRWFIYNALKEKYSNVNLTYGYLTKNTRIKNHLEKSHRVDARCITNVIEEPLEYYQIKQIRSNNRQLHKNTIKGGIRKNNIAPGLIKGFQLFDKVLYNNEVSFIYGRRSTGYFKIAAIEGKTIHNSVNCSKLKLLEKAKTLLIIKKRSGVSSPCLKAGVSTPSF